MHFTSKGPLRAASQAAQLAVRAAGMLRSPKYHQQHYAIAPAGMCMLPPSMARSKGLPLLGRAVHHACYFILCCLAFA
jgi:hypothetical protein